MKAVVCSIAMLLYLQACKAPVKNEPASVPVGCDAVKFKEHQRRLAAVNSLEKSLQITSEREPLTVGAGIPRAEVSGITLTDGSDGYVLVFAHFSVATKQTTVYVQSDGIDHCYAGISIGEFRFSDQQAQSLLAAMELTRRIDEPVEECPGQMMSDVVSLHFKDSTFTNYLVKRDSTCRRSADKNLPLLSDEFFQLQADLGATLLDVDSPY